MPLTLLPARSALPTYAPPAGAAYFQLTVELDGLDVDTVVRGLSDGGSPLALALCKFASCAASAAQAATRSTT